MFNFGLDFEGGFDFGIKLIVHNATAAGAETAQPPKPHKPPGHLSFASSNLCPPPRSTNFLCQISFWNFEKGKNGFPYDSGLS